MKWRKERIKNREKKGKKGESREAVGKRTGEKEGDGELDLVL
jgi:hypothetical protein